MSEETRRKFLAANDSFFELGGKKIEIKGRFPCRTSEYAQTAEDFMRTGEELRHVMRWPANGNEILERPAFKKQPAVRDAKLTPEG